MNRSHYLSQLNITDYRKRQVGCYLTANQAYFAPKILVILENKPYSDLMHATLKGMLSVLNLPSQSISLLWLAHCNHHSLLQVQSLAMSAILILDCPILKQLEALGAIENAEQSYFKTNYPCPIFTALSPSAILSNPKLRPEVFKQLQAIAKQLAK